MSPVNISSHQKQLEFEDNQFLSSLFGYHDKNLKVLENKFKVKLYTRGNLLSIKGNRDPVEKAYFIIQGLYQKLKNNDISAEEIENNIDLAKPTYIKEQIEQDQKFQINTKLKTIYPKTKNQELFLKEMRSKDVVFAVGPAGTGKTYLAVAYAVSLFVEGKINRLILSRPAVEAGERLGFLPGDMKEKIDPYLRPLYDALYEMMPGEEIDRKMVNNLIEIAPLAFMRGRTLNKSFIILDEAQNTLSTQMKMFLTRLGQNSKMVITGDLSQKDFGKFKVLKINHSEKEIILSNGSKKFECKILKENPIDQSYIIKINGEISTIRLIKQVEKTIEKLGIQKGSQKNINILKAPMPGLILDVVVKESDLVKKGDPVIILEAMKMENILSSPVDGKVKEIKVNPQQTVEKNNILVKFEA